MKRKRWIYAAAAIVAVIAAYSAYWFYVAGQLELGIDDWVEIQRRNGVEMAFSRDKIHGFPGDFRTNIHDPMVKLPVNGWIMTWSGADLALSMSPFDLRAIAFSTPGKHHFEGPDVNLYIQVEKLDGRIETDATGQLIRAVLDIRAIHLTLPNSEEIGASSAYLAVGLPGRLPVKYPDLLAGFDLAAENVTLPAGTKLLTTDPLIRIAAAGAIQGPLPQAPIDEALSAWRDAGGVIDLKSLAFAQGPLAVTGNATLALDRNLQPEGAASLKVRGLPATIDLLAQQGLIPKLDALKFKAFAIGASEKGADGVQEVSTGLSLQDSVLSWGPIAITRVPEVVW